tara:strand:- start:6967 stop:7707 length:741 start_codon:yes stop_codon:yes gene_type:complete
MKKGLEPIEDNLELVQRRSVRRFRLSNVFSWILDGFSMDHGAFYTIKNLFYRPGEMVRSYIYQGRLDFTPPIRLLLVTTTLVLIAFKYSSVNQFTLEAIKGPNENFSNEEATNYFMQILEDYTNVILWLFIPIMALFSWLFNRKSGYNYAENLVLNTYYTVFVNIIFLMFLTDKWINDLVLMTMYIILSTFHYMLSLKGMFQLTWLKSFWQTILIFLIAFTFYSISLSVILATVIIYFTKTGQVAN